MGIMRHLFTDEASTDYLVDNYRYQLSWQSEKNAFIENPDLPMMSAQGWSESLRELEKMETIIRRRGKEKDQTTILFLILELKEEKMKVKKNIYRQYEWWKSATKVCKWWKFSGKSKKMAVTWIPGYPDTWIPRYLDTWIPRYPDTRF